MTRALPRTALPRRAAEAIAASGIRVQLAREVTPTPALSYMVRELGAAGGVMITSSHNPWNWNGVKYKASYGGSATPAITKKIEALIDSPAIEGKGGAVVEADFKTAYIAAIQAFADLKQIAAAKQKFAIDVMYGAGRGILAGIFQQFGVEHIELHGEINPLFPGINPEPILPHLRELQQAVVAQHCAAGLATDGDADRIGAVDEDGNVVDASHVLRCCWSGSCCASSGPAPLPAPSTPRGMLDRIARAHGRPLIEHGVGFKHVVDIVLGGTTVLIGGEESGGIGIPRFLPERDGTLNALLLANVMAEEGKSAGPPGGGAAGDIWTPLLRTARPAPFRCGDAACPATGRGPPSSIGKYNVLRIEDLDGFKFFLDAPTGDNGAEAWVLLRGSGTEPLLRVYGEAAAPETAERNP